MRKTLIVIENAGANFSAYSPDLPGCIATGASREEVEANMQEAVRMHVKGLTEDSSPLGGGGLGKGGGQEGGDPSGL